MFDNLVGYLEALFWIKSKNFLEALELICTECRTVDLAGVLLLRRRPPNDGLEDDERRLVGDSLCCLNGVVQSSDVFNVNTGLLPVHRLDVPVVGLVTLGYIFGERNGGVIFDRDLVGVINRDEVTQLLVASKRGSFSGDTFLQVAVTRNDIDEVIEGALACSCVGVKQTALEARCVSKTNSRSQALSERTSGDFNTLGVAILRVTGSE